MPCQDFSRSLLCAKKAASPLALVGFGTSLFLLLLALPTTLPLPQQTPSEFRYPFSHHQVSSIFNPARQGIVALADLLQNHLTRGSVVSPSDPLERHIGTFPAKI